MLHIHNAVPDRLHNETLFYYLAFNKFSTSSQQQHQYLIASFLSPVPNFPPWWMQHLSALFFLLFQAYRSFEHYMLYNILSLFERCVDIFLLLLASIFSYLRLRMATTLCNLPLHILYKYVFLGDSIFSTSGVTCLANLPYHFG